ncbi:5935_t:CDS:2 [Acaulospora morrowiae]|uniref:5935_t:CDS:1 n=1 Tax=Acaulospora morrowiae TaxID=94023 RepID=A0A9N9FRD2_9GLOM|nr:5935_t:CDS:2 [Acaulospora morrowiae]
MSPNKELMTFMANEYYSRARRSYKEMKGPYTLPRNQIGKPARAIL